MSALPKPVLVLGFLATAALSAWAAEPPEIRDEPRTIDPAAFLPAELSEPVTCEFSESSLRELIEWLREERGLTVLLHRGALDEFGMSEAEPISDHLDDAPLYLLLNRLSQLELDWYFESGILHITSKEESLARLVTKTYNVGELIDAGYDVDSLMDGITSTVDSDSWAENGGGQAEIRALGDVLFVSQSDPIQRQIEALLAALGNHGRQTLVGEPASHQAIRQALEKKLSVEFDNTPLATAAAELADLAGVDIRLDRASLRDARIRVREPVSLTLRDRDLSTVLDALLLDLELTWVLRDGVLWITTEDEAWGELKVAVYDVRDLCQDGSEADALLEAILSQTDASTWAENGGGDAEIRSVLPGTLVVSQQEVAHNRLLQLLEAYRTALRSSKPRPVNDESQTVETVYYRVYEPAAAGLMRHLQGVVAPETWRSGKRPDAPGEISLVSSPPKVVSPQKGAAAGSPALIDQAVLIIKQTRAAHDEIAEIIRRIESADSHAPASTPGFGGGGGSFGGGLGGGAFAVPDHRGGGRSAPSER